MRGKRCRLACWEEFYRMNVNAVPIPGGLIALLLSGLPPRGSSSITGKSTIGAHSGLVEAFGISCKWHTAFGHHSIHRPSAKIKW